MDERLQKHVTSSACHWQPVRATNSIFAALIRGPELKPVMRAASTKLVTDQIHNQPVIYETAH